MWSESLGRYIGKEGERRALGLEGRGRIKTKARGGHEELILWTFANHNGWGLLQNILLASWLIIGCRY